MSNLEAYYIPKKLDEPARFLFWSWDEATMMLIPTFMGIVLGYTITGMLLGVGAFFAWRELKGNGQTNLVIYGSYWFLPSKLFKLRGTPPSHYRLYVG